MVARIAEWRGKTQQMFAISIKWWNVAERAECARPPHDVAHNVCSTQPLSVFNLLRFER